MAWSSIHCLNDFIRAVYNLYKWYQTTTTSAARCVACFLFKMWCYLANNEASLSLRVFYICILLDLLLTIVCCVLGALLGKIVEHEFMQVLWCTINSLLLAIWFRALFSLGSGFIQNALWGGSSNTTRYWFVENTNNLVILLVYKKKKHYLI